METALTRRTLLKGGLAAGAGLTIGFPLLGRIPGAVAQAAGVSRGGASGVSRTLPVFQTP